MWSTDPKPRLLPEVVHEPLQRLRARQLLADPALGTCLGVEGPDVVAYLGLFGYVATVLRLLAPTLQL